MAICIHVFAVGLGLAGSRKTEFYKFDPTIDAWTALQNINYNYHLYNTTTFTSNGKGYMATGSINNPPSGSITTNAVFMYDPSNDTWTPKNNFTGGARLYGAGFSVLGNSYIGLGWDGNFLTDLWRYNDVADNWTQVNDFTPGSRLYASTFTLNDIAYIGNGRSPTSISYDTFYSWQPSLSTIEFQNQTFDTMVSNDKIVLYSNQNLSNYQLNLYNLKGCITPRMKVRVLG